jgi:hypothetical protein
VKDHSDVLRLPRLGCAVAAFAAAVNASFAIAQALPAPPEPPSAATVPPAQPIPAARWTPELIRQSFDQADTDSDGQLTRAEGRRLAILPRSFEDMGENKDGVLQRREYENAFSR